mmetsp:Transcript_33972/g.44839  ORF Transcript_33972/g.44839 Transcript_33972/m.44839 type:complete len:341 (-) Transcript_33972:202-1224(-)
MEIILDVIEATAADVGGWKLQYTGIIVGIVVYLLTVIAVILLLIFGGSFKRMREQAQEYSEKGPAAFKKPSERAKLYDHLLTAMKELPVKPDIPEKNLCGKYVMLRPLNTESTDFSKLFEISDGSARYGHGVYHPDEMIWPFLSIGPFQSSEQMKNSNFGLQLENGIRFVVVDKFTENVIGSISLLNNEPASLRVQIGDLWITPAYQDKEYIYTECYFLLMDSLFDVGYRRIELSLDEDDSTHRKYVEQMGFSLEGTLRKHMVVRESSRNTAVYSLLNSEWDFASEKFKRKLKENEKLPAFQIWSKKQKQKEKELEFSVSKNTLSNVDSATNEGNKKKQE